MFIFASVSRGCCDRMIAKADWLIRKTGPGNQDSQDSLLLPRHVAQWMSNVKVAPHLDVGREKEILIYSGTQGPVITAECGEPKWNDEMQ